MLSNKNTVFVWSQHDGGNVDKSTQLLHRIINVKMKETEMLAGCFSTDQKCPYLHTSN